MPDFVGCRGFPISQVSLLVQSMVNADVSKWFLPHGQTPARHNMNTNSMPDFVKISSSAEPPAASFSCLSKNLPRMRGDQTYLRRLTLLESGGGTTNVAGKHIKETSMQINQIMTPRCKTCSPADSLHQAAQYMAQKGIGVLPIAEDFNDCKGGIRCHPERNGASDALENPKNNLIYSTC